MSQNQVQKQTDGCRRLVSSTVSSQHGLQEEQRDFISDSDCAAIDSSNTRKTSRIMSSGKRLRPHTPELNVVQTSGKWPRLVIEDADQHQIIDSGGSPDVGVEVEIEAESSSEEQKTLNRRQMAMAVVSVKSPKHLSPPAPFQASSSQHRRQPMHRGRAGTQYTAQQLIRFDPMQCFDIDELRNRMVEAQRRIEDSASMHLNYNKMKNENANLREELMRCDQRVGILGMTVCERNERLRELLRENVFMRTQYKKIQLEFGVEAVREVFNRQM